MGLCSGGLDSILSALVLRDQGIEVHWVTFETPFFSAGKAREASRMTGVPLRVERITEVYLSMLRNPRLGYGKNMNPCPDCHALMFQLAGRIMEEEGYDFLFSGEVLAQRPMSQNRPALGYVVKHSGYAGRILRPLCAKRLPPTEPELAGLVDRERLLDLAGRSRKPQMALAERYGITSYPTPAGGCLLTDAGFSRRLADLFAHETERPFTERDLDLLKYGRHLRLSPTVKAVVGRQEAENARIEELFDPAADVLVGLAPLPGPRVLVPYGAPPELLEKAAGLCLFYASKKIQGPVPARLTGPGGLSRTLLVKALERSEVESLIL